MLALLFLASCNNTSNSSESDSELSIVLEKGGLKVSEVYSLPFESSKLLEVSPSDNSSIIDTGAVNFSFDVSNYQLGDQTELSEERLCANSAEGQHIHLILNNEPYSAHYDAEFPKKLEKGQYVALAFLSRSYHESLKNKEAFKLWKFSVGEELNSDFDVNSPQMFYSRPKGTYKGADTKKLLLDFYLTNTDLSDDGNKVIAEINGNTFVLNKWAPFIIEGLPMGEVKIKLSLVDEEGHLVKSPFNPVERTVVLEE